MALSQFAVYKTRGDAARLAPYLVALQNELLASLHSVIVAPMRTAKAHGPIVRKLHVPVKFHNCDYVISPEQLVSLPRTALGAHAGSLAAHRQDLMAAIDFLFIGY